MGLLNISNKREVTLVLIGLGVMFALGRYSMQSEGGKTESHTETQITKDKDTHKRTDTTIVQTPDGTKTTHTTIDEDTTTHQDTTKQKDVVKTEPASKRPVLNVSGLAGVDTMDRFKPVYGVSVSKEFIGPVTVGAFALTNGVVGLSVGVNF